MNEQKNDIWVVTFTVDTPDPHWATANTIIARPEKMAELFDLSALPFGARLLKGKQARRFLKQAVKHEQRFQREMKFNRNAGGAN
jgi:hypothetical protein